MKKLITFFSFLILTSTVFANSVGGSIGGWQVVSNVAQGVGAKITATKEVVINGVSKTLSSTANITPKATNIAKFMGKAAGLSLAIDAMDYLLDGVDYVLDPSNNTLKYNTKGEIAPYNHPSFPLFYTSSGQADTRSSSASGSCSLYNQRFIAAGSEARFKYVPHAPVNNQVGRCVNTLRETSYVLVQSTPNSNYDPQAQSPEGSRPVSVPISTIGQQVVDKAEQDIKSGNPSSPAVALSRAAAQDMIQEAEAENDNVKPNPIATELDKTTTYPTTEDAVGTVDTPAVVDPVTGEIVKPAETSNVDIKIPKACEWFPQACLFFEWMQKEPELDEDLELPTKEIDKKEIKDNLITISSNSCPAPYPVSIELPVLKTVYTDSIDISPYCSEIEKLAPVLQLLAFVLAVFIIKDI